MKKITLETETIRKAAEKELDTGATDRVNRWRRHAKEIAGAMGTRELDAICAARNTNPSDYVVEYLKHERGMNGGDAREAYHRTHDMELDRMPAGARRSEERRIVREAFVKVGWSDTKGLTDAEVLVLAEFFMEPGDWSIDAAVMRAAKAGISAMTV